MGNRIADLPPEQVISWLRSPAGEQWAQERIGRTLDRWGHGVFADVVPDQHLAACKAASWPEPCEENDLGDG